MALLKLMRTGTLEAQSGFALVLTDALGTRSQPAELARLYERMEAEGCFRKLRNDSASVTADNVTNAMKSAETLAFNVARLMRARKLKQRSLRGVSQTNMRRVLAGKGCTLSTLDKIAEALKVRPVELLGWQRDRLSRLFYRLTIKQREAMLKSMIRTAWENRAILRELTK